MVKAPADPALPEDPVETLPLSLPDLPRPDEDSRLAAGVKALVRDGQLAAARDRFGELVGRQQRRASRIAYHFLRDAADADEAVQDAFVKVFSHIESFREDLPFEVWFTRILDQRLPRPAEGPKAPGALDRAGAGRGARRARLGRVGADARGLPGGVAAPTGAPHADRGSRREIARTPADDLPAVPLRGMLVEGSQHDNRVERVDGSRAPVPRRSEAALAARREPMRTGSFPSR